MYNVYAFAGISFLSAALVLNANNIRSKDVTRIYLLNNGMVLRIENSMGESIDVPINNVVLQGVQ